MWWQKVLPMWWHYASLPAGLRERNPQARRPVATGGERKHVRSRLLTDDGARSRRRLGQSGDKT